MPTFFRKNACPSKSRTLRKYSKRPGTHGRNNCRKTIPAKIPETSHRRISTLRAGENRLSVKRPTATKRFKIRTVNKAGGQV